MHFNHVKVASLAVSGLAALATASPLQVSVLDKRADSSEESKWCDGSKDLGSYDKAKEVYERLSLGEVMVAIAKQKGWIQTMEDEMDAGIEREGGQNCETLGVSCQPGKHNWDCNKYYEEGQKDSEDEFLWKRLYWAFKAARGMHDKITLMSNALRDATLKESLGLDNMTKAFEPKDDARMDASNFKGWLTAAVGVSNMLTGFTPFPMVSSFGATLINNLPTESDEEISIGQIESTLGNYFESVSSSLNKTVAYANGGDGNADDMPQIHWAEHFKEDSPRGQLFASPIWYIDNNAPEVRALVEGTKTNVRLKVLDTVVQAAGYALMPAGDDNKEECNEKLGHWWLDSKSDEGELCFTLYENRHDEWSSRRKADDHIFRALVDNGMDDLQAYYNHALRCARSGGSGSSKVDAQKLIDGDTPSCFFSLPVKKVTYDSSDVFCGVDNCTEDEKSDTVGDFYDD